jgi:hypothetical protein
VISDRRTLAFECGRRSPKFDQLTCNWGLDSSTPNKVNLLLLSMGRAAAVAPRNIWLWSLRLFASKGEPGGFLFWERPNGGSTK